MTGSQKASIGGRDAARSRAACFHCGEPVLAPGRFTLHADGAVREFCCAGCLAVSQTIVGSSLTAFYAARTAPAAPADPAEVLPLGDLAVYDRPEIQAPFVETAADGTREATLLLEGITCAACVWLNEQHLARQPGIVSAHVNHATRRARVRWDPARIRLSEILAAVQAIGYRAWPNDSAAAEAMERREAREGLWRLFVAGFGMMQVMMYAYPAYIAGEGEMTADITALFRWASLILTLPVVLYSAAPFFRGAWRDLRFGRAGMDVPVALGIAAAFAGSTWATVSGRGDVYFDSVAMFVFFLLGGRWLEGRARRRSMEALRRLSRALPATAERLAGFPADRATETVPAIALRPGDHVLVRPGAAFPADGTVVEGVTRADESMLTGESVPVAKGAGSAVVGGAGNVSQPVVVRVDRAGTETRLGSIVRLVERAHAERPRLAELADRFAARFVFVVLGIAGLVAVAWGAIDASRALPAAVAVLVVTCPCALSLAMPAVLSVATAAMARLGLIVTRERAIETLARVTHVVLDKTGTLTEGVFAVVMARPFGRWTEARCRAVAAAMEAGSDHPVARALRDGDAGGVAVAVGDVRHEAGAGIEAIIDGDAIRLGSRRFVEALTGPLPDAAVPAGTTEVWLGGGSGALGVFALGDRLRPGAAEAVRRLQAAGVETLLASGDRRDAVEAVAAQCGIGTAHWDQTPEDKQRLVAALQAGGAVVCMVGDGINDAPVLARADVSVAVGSGAALAQQAADIVLVAPRLAALAGGLGLARHAMRIVRGNLAWAFAYNVVTIPLAAFGVLTPWLAGLGMSASSLLVVLNALRVRAPAVADEAVARASVPALTAEN